MTQTQLQDSRYEFLRKWAIANGAALNEGVGISVDDAMGASFVAEADIEEGVPLVSCPMGLTLSYLNLRPGSSVFRDPYAPCEPCATTKRASKVPNVALPSSVVDATPAHVLGRILLMQQFLVGKESFWAPYIDVLPEPEDLFIPAIWDREDVDMCLGGSALEASVTNIQNTLNKEYEALWKIEIDGERPTWWNSETFTWPLYHWAYAVFTSRSFMPSLVVPESTGLAGLLPEGVSTGDFSILLPLFDLGNHDGHSKIQWKLTDDSVALSVARRHVKGEQIYNNYGDKSNTQLFLSYGFMEEDTPERHNNYVHLQPRGQGKKDYLLSGRPVSDPSSQLIHKRLILPYTERPADVLQGFARVEDKLVLELLATLMPLPQVAEAIGTAPAADNSEAEILRASRDILKVVLTGKVEGRVKSVLQRVMATVMNQAWNELEKLANEDMDWETSGVELDDYQKMSVDWRARERKVLEGVLENVDEQWLG